jgi:hypothetical protein
MLATRMLAMRLLSICLPDLSAVSDALRYILYGIDRDERRMGRLWFVAI